MRNPLTGHRRLALGLAVSVTVGIAGAFVNTRGETQIAGAATHVLVERPAGSVVPHRTRYQETETFAKRAALLGELMASDPVRSEIAKLMVLDAQRIVAVARTTSNVPDTLLEPDGEQRAHEISVARERYHLDVQAKPAVPVLDIFTQAPSPTDATRLADASIAGLRAHLAERAKQAGRDPASVVQLTQIGATRASIINPGAAIQIGVLTFLVLFALSCCAMVAAFTVRDRQAARRSAGGAETAPSAGATGWSPGSGVGAMALAAPVAIPRVAGGAAAVPWELTMPQGVAKVRRAVGADGDWPHTTRVLPWMIAAFVAVVWLVPFNSIQLSISTPIDLKLDRLILPFIAGAWVLALVAGGRSRPKLRCTPVHLGVGAFVALAFLSVVLRAPYLNHTLEFDLAVKKLVLLLSYLSMFVIVASVMRRSKIPAFLTYMLGLAVIAALGTVWEYRFEYNVFYGLADALLPGFFTVGAAEASAVDEIGRRIVRGPAELGLEAVAMLTMAVPIAVIRIMTEKNLRRRLLYGAAVCLLLAASIATFRKSAFIAPIAVFMTIGYFRRRYLLRLAPLGLVLVVLVQALAPGAIGAIGAQLDSDRLSVATVSDRTADYDAIRPDVWTGMLFGRGFGTYDHNNYRILDSEILLRLVEGGVLGLAAYLFMSVAVIGAARRTIRSADPVYSGIALAAASVGAAFVVLSFLFDVLAFPHVPYLFLIWAGILAVVVRDPPAAAAPV